MSSTIFAVVLNTDAELSMNEPMDNNNRAVGQGHDVNTGLEGKPTRGTHRQQFAGDLIEKICTEFENAWQAGSQPTAADYLATLEDDEIREQLRCELVKLEQHYRGPEVAVKASIGGISATRNIENTRKQPHRHIQYPVHHEYQILGKLGEGGMGAVYKALQTSLGRIVALKKIKSGVFASSEEVARFIAEAEAAARLDHRGIVPVYEIGHADGEHYFSMGYIEGTTLAAELRDGPLPPRQAALIVEQVASAICYAHEQGIVHRDLKPANVLIDGTGDPRVTDFGLAKQVTSNRDLTQTGQVMGTPSYMPPEQAAAGEVGTHSDIYALGAILYACVTGRPPHQSPNTLDTLLAVVNDEPALPRSIDRKIPRDLETICLKAISKSPRRRYESAGELAADLTRWLNDEPIKARRVGRLEKAVLWCKRYPVIASLVALLAVVLTIGTFFYFDGRNATHARGLVDSLLKAGPQQVSGVIDQIEDYKWWTKADLEERIKAAKDGSRQQLLLRLARLRFDQTGGEELLEPMLRSRLSEFGFVSQELAPHAKSLTEQLWQELRKRGNEPRRFRAGMALAQYVPAAERWTEGDVEFLASQLTSAFPEQQPFLRDQLRPIAAKLMPLLTATYRDGTATERSQDNSATALADFSRGDVKQLTILALEGTAAQYQRLFPIVESRADKSTRQLLEQLVKRQARANLTEAARVKLGRYRAIAAITLLRLGARRKVFDVFRVREDPESLTQFVHCCKDRGVTAMELLECLDLADRDRQSLTGTSRMVADRVIFGLLLCLGEFSLNELPQETGAALVNKLIHWYAHDPRSGIHGATGWLLRTWGHEEATRQIDQTPVPYKPGREWYVEKIEVQSSGKSTSIYLTMIVFPAGEFTMGTPKNEANHELDEPRRVVRISRPVAISDREITWGQFDIFDKAQWHQAMNEQFGSKTINGSYPVFGRSWFDAVDFCRWLNKSVGFSLADECYINPGGSIGLVPWQLRIGGKGYRLPTEAEWELMARSGTATAFSFGSDRDRLRYYGWFLKNSNDWSHPVGFLRPNVRGLFDVHGNMAEWCHNWYAFETRSETTDPTAAVRGPDRSVRGGSWGLGDGFCRSGDRNGSRPTGRNYLTGFRVAQNPLRTSEQAKSGKNDSH